MAEPDIDLMTGEALARSAGYRGEPEPKPEETG